MAKPEGRSYRRRKLVVNRQLQYRFVAVMLLLLVAMVAIAMMMIYLTLMGTLEIFELQNDPVTVALFTTVGLALSLELFVVGPFVAWMAIVVTHKVAGPAVRILATLQEMTRGNYDIAITLRKGDALTEIADAVNALAASLRRRRT